MRGRTAGNRYFSCFVYLLLLFCCTPLCASDAGIPLLQVFTPGDYTGHSQNWSVLQGADGLIYAGNGAGMLQYDGARWHIYRTPHNTRVRRVINARPGHMLAATTDDLFDIEVANSPFPPTQMHSLTTAWPEQARGFGEAMGLERTSAGIFLQASHRILLTQDGGAPHQWQSEAGFQQSFALGDDWYVLDRARGLLRVGVADTQAAEVPLAPDGARLAGDQVSFMLRRRNGDIVVASRKLGLLRYRDGQLQSWPTEIDRWMSEQIVMPGAELDDGSLVLGSLRAGIARIDGDGRLLQFLDERDGLPSNSVYALATDNQGGLWAGLDGGIARIAWPGAISRFDKRQGLATVWGIGRHQQHRVLATRLGLMVAQPSQAGRPTHFERVAGQPTQAWETLSVGDELWIAGSDGVWRIRDTSMPASAWQAEHIHAARFAYSLLHDARDAQVVFAATAQGVLRISSINDPHPVAEMLAGYSGESRQLAQDRDGGIWAGTPNGRLLHLPAGAKQLRVLDDFDRVPAGMTWPATVDGDLVVGTGDGLQRFDGQRLVDSAALEAVNVQCRTVSRVKQVSPTAIWVACGDFIGVANRAVSGEWEFERDPLRGLTSESAYAFFADADGSLWIGRERDLVRVDGKVPLPVLPAMQPRLRGAYVIGDQGFRPLDISAGANAWPAGTEQLRLQFALPIFALAEPVRFNSHLEGIDSDRVGSHWEAQRDYTNLAGGSYRFRIRAEVLERFGTSLPTDFQFSIAQPWYRKTWAMLLWIAMASALIWFLGAGIARWRSRVLIAQNLDLERVVGERTQALQLQTERLKQIDLAKTRFFAGVAHDVRSPLILILEPLQELLRGVFGVLPRPAMDQINRVESNARRLNRLVESLLDLHHIEAGQRRVQPVLQDAVKFVEGVLAHFSGWAEEHQILLTVDVSAVRGPARFDAQALEQVLFNVIGNALKYVPEAGRIDITLAGGGEAALELRVRDNGPGFAAELIAQVFDHYVRGEETLRRRLPGSGLGLALCRELVQAHGGRIQARNAIDGGAEIQIELPSAILRADPANDEPEPVDDAQEAVTAVVSTTLADAVPAMARDDRDQDDRTTVLLVDDNSELRAFLAARLQNDYRVLEASDGCEALALARRALPDVVVSDVQMPLLDGLALTRALRADIETDTIPILLMASHGAVAERIAGLEVGANDFLGKPFHVSELIARVCALISAQRQLRARLVDGGVLATRLTAVVEEPEFLRRVRVAIDARLDDSQFGVSELAAALHIERSTLFKRLKALDLESPVQLLRNHRLDASAALLARRAGQVTEIAYACGFESLSYFSRVFRERFGKTPREYADH